jgi:hypothetical protein
VSREEEVKIESENFTSGLVLLFLAEQQDKKENAERRV